MPDNMIIITFVHVAINNYVDYIIVVPRFNKLFKINFLTCGFCYGTPYYVNMWEIMEHHSI